MEKSDGTLLSLPVLMGRISAYLETLTVEVIEIEHALSESLDRIADITPDSMKRLQRLDFVRQSLQDLTVLTASSENIGHDALLEKTIKLLQLDQTRCLLYPKQCGIIPATSGGSSDEVDLF